MASEAVCVSVPEVPVKVAVADPGAVPAAAVTVRRVVAAAEPGAGSKREATKASPSLLPVSPVIAT